MVGGVFVGSKGDRFGYEAIVIDERITGAFLPGGRTDGANALCGVVVDGAGGWSMARRWDDTFVFCTGAG